MRPVGYNVHLRHFQPFRGENEKCLNVHNGTIITDTCMSPNAYIGLNYWAYQYISRALIKGFWTHTSK